MTGSPYTLYGWHLSYFAGKARCYLLRKGIPFIDRDVDLLTLLFRIKPRFGTPVMPVLVTPEGEWLQDTSVIIDRLESRFPSPSVIPADPVQRLAAYVMELWGDEWWIPMAMQTRWAHDENYALFEAEAGRALLPWAPRFAQKQAVARIARLLRSYLPAVGAIPEQGAAIEDWTRAMLDQFDAHFRTMPFLFGDAPTLGDFGLVGTMYGHLGRDPWPKREMVDPRKALRSWIDRMAAPASGTPGETNLRAGIAPTLEPVFRAIFREVTPWVRGTLHEIERIAPGLAPGQRLPRRLGLIDCPFGQGSLRRAAMPYTLWMVQRLQDMIQAMPDNDRKHAEAWAAPLGGGELLSLAVPRLERLGLHVALAATH